MTMRKLPLVFLLASGCAFFGIGKKDTGPSRAEQEEKLRELGGEQLVADVKMVEALPEGEENGEYQVKQCMTQYLYGHKHLKEGKDTSARGNFLSCHKMCEAAAKRDEGGKYEEFTSRYITDCKDRRMALEGGSHLARAEKKIEEFEKAEGKMNWYYRDMEVRGAFKQAAEALGEDNEDLAKLQAKYDEVKAPREDGLQLAKDFMAREDIRELNQYRDDLRAQIRGLEEDAKYSETAKVLLQQRKRDLKDADNEFSTKWTEAKSAG